MASNDNTDRLPEYIHREENAAPRAYSPDDMLVLGKAFMLVFKERNDLVEAKIKVLSEPSSTHGLLLSQWKARIPSQDYPKMLANLHAENEILSNALRVISRYDKPISIGGYRRQRHTRRRHTRKYGNN